jgi:molybdopterin adenylyltransferase
MALGKPWQVKMRSDKQITFGILTISDRSYQGIRPDTAGPALVDLVTAQSWQVSRVAAVPDEIDQIKQILTEWSDDHSCQILLTTGGTGFAPRDVTPEATMAVIERLTPGLAEAMRAESLKVTPHAMLSRAVCGIRKQTLIINLPGSPKGAIENLQMVIPVLPHAVELINGLPDSETGHHV